MELRIRTPLISDISHIQALYAGWFRDTQDEIETENVEFFTDLVKTFISNPNAEEKYLICENNDGELLSIVGYRNSPTRMLLDYVSTKKPVQLVVLMVARDSVSRGVGTYMLKHFEHVASEHFHTEIILTSSKRWKNSWPFYLKRGYTDLGELKDSSQSGTRVFSKKIKEA